MAQYHGVTFQQLNRIGFECFQAYERQMRYIEGVTEAMRDADKRQVEGIDEDFVRMFESLTAEEQTAKSAQIAMSWAVAHAIVFAIDELRPLAEQG